MAHFLVYNVLAKFELFCIITCRDILYFVFWLSYCHTLWRHQYIICIIQKSWISLERDEIWQKGKRHSSSLLKAFQIRPFFNTTIFHFIGTLKTYCKTLLVSDYIFRPINIKHFYIKHIKQILVLVCQETIFSPFPFHDLQGKLNFRKKQKI